MAVNRRAFHAQELAFLAAINEEPRDNTPRLIYADWLEERGDSAQAEFIRLQCQQDQCGDDWWKYEYSPREKSLVKKYSFRWLGEKVSQQGYLSSKLRFYGFRRGFPAVSSTGWNSVYYAEEATQRLKHISPHFQLNVCINVAAAGPMGAGNPYVMLGHAIVQRAASITIFALNGPGDYRPLPDGFVEATILAVGNRRLIKVTFGPVSDKGRELIHDHLSHVPVGFRKSE